MERTAVVTGGASGIGKRTVERLLQEGWKVWAFDISDSGLHALSEQYKGNPGFRARKCDVSSLQSVTAAFQDVARETSSIDALICSAAVFRVGSLEEMTAEQVDQLVNTNFKGVWYSVNQSLTLLRKNASPEKPSRVVIVGSIAGIRPKVGTGIYAALKAAVHVLTGMYGYELAPSGVIVNAVAPGSIDTPLARDGLEMASTHSRFKPSGKSPLGRIGQPDDVADVILFFLSDAAKYVNGTVLPSDGGTRAAFLMT